MSRKKEKKIVLSELEPEERLKYEIAEELGLLDQVMEKGWKSLSSRETGRIGGIVKNRRKMFKNCEQSEAVSKYFSRKKKCIIILDFYFLFLLFCIKIYTDM